MYSVLAGASTTAVFEFLEDGVYLNADANSVSWTLRGNDGSVIASQVVNNVSPLQRLEVLVDGANNTNAFTFEYRTVVVDFAVNGNPRQVRQTYRVTDWLPHIVTPQNVRDFLGIDVDELPDSSIDIDKAYFSFANEAGKLKLDNALTAGDVTADACNNAIIATAALDVLSSLQLRVRQSQTSDTAQASRYSKIDFGLLARRAEEARADALVAINGGSSTDPTFFGVYTGTDAITGA